MTKLKTIEEKGQQSITIWFGKDKNHKRQIEVPEGYIVIDKESEVSWVDSSSGTISGIPDMYFDDRNGKWAEVTDDMVVDKNGKFIYKYASQFALVAKHSSSLWFGLGLTKPLANDEYFIKQQE